MEANTLDRYAAQFERLGDGDSLQPLRRRAMMAFQSRGLPTQREEDWRYTSVAPVVQTPFEPAPERAAALTEPQLKSLLVGNLGALRMVFVDGNYVPGLSTPGPDLENLAQAPASLLQPHWEHLDPSAHPFAALNTAFCRDGALVRIGKGKTLPSAVHLVFVSTGGAPPTVSHPRTLILAEAGSSATVIETFIGAGRGATFTNAVTQIAAGPDASVQHVKLQLEAEAAFHLGMIQVRQERGSSVACHGVSFGAALSRSEVHAALNGEGSSCTLNGLYVAAGSQHTDSLTVIDHAKPHCTSQELYKGILQDKARGVFFGRIIVRPDAQKTEAHQTNQNLLLSEDAEVDTRPQLRIDADDVACTHGATVGRLDEAAIFYLRSRGISPESARSLLTHAFAEDIFDRIPVPGIKDQLTAQACGWLTRHLGGVPR